MLPMTKDAADTDHSATTASTAYSWQAGMRSDGVQISQRLQTVIRFQIASTVQSILDATLAPQIQLQAVAVVIVGTEFCVDRLKLSSLASLRAVAVIQSGQCILTYLDTIDQHDTSSHSSSKLTSWLIATCSLCIPGMLSSSLRHNTYISNAVTVFLYQYTAATRHVVTMINVGLSPIYIAALCVLLALRLRVWQDTEVRTDIVSLYVYYFKAFHMLVVELLLFSIADMMSYLSGYAQLIVQFIVVLSIDAVNTGHLLDEVRGYAIWRVSRLLLQVDDADLPSLDAMLTAGMAMLLFISRRLPMIHSMYQSTHSLHTVIEILFLSCISLILRPITTTGNVSDTFNLLRIIFVSTIAENIEHFVQAQTK